MTKLTPPKTIPSRIILPPGPPPTLQDVDAAFLAAKTNLNDPSYLKNATRLRNRYEKEVCVSMELRKGSISYELFVSGHLLVPSVTPAGKKVLQGKDSAQYPGITACLGKYAMVCVLCYNNQDKTLEKCVRTSTLFGTGNYSKHFKACHKEVQLKRKSTGDIADLLKTKKKTRLIRIMFAVLDQLRSWKDPIIHRGLKKEERIMFSTFWLSAMLLVDFPIHLTFND